MDPINPLGEMGIDMLVCGTPCSRRPDPGALRTEGRPPVTVIVDRADDVRFTRTVLASHHPAAGRVVVHPTVGSGDRLLWHDVLHAIADGRPLRAPACAARGNQFQQENSVRAALKAEAVRRLTILRAHRIGLGLWADLVHLHRTTRADVVVVHHAELHTGTIHFLRHCDHRLITTHAGTRALHPPARPPRHGR